MNKNLLIPLIIALVAIIIFYLVSSTLSAVILFIPGVILSYIFYLNTIYRKMPKPERILTLYLFALGIQFIHFTEEYLTDFVTAVPGLIGREPYPLDYWISFNMIAYFIFIIGGIILFKQIKELMIIPLFFILVGVVLNSIGHILLAIYVGGYFSGLYSALIYVILGPMLLKRILDESKVMKLQ